MCSSRKICFLFLGPIWFSQHFGLPAPVLHFGATQSEQSRELWIHMKYIWHLKVLTAEAPQPHTNKRNFSHSLGFNSPNLPPDIFPFTYIGISNQICTIAIPWPKFPSHQYAKHLAQQAKMVAWNSCSSFKHLLYWCFVVKQIDFKIGFPQVLTEDYKSVAPNWISFSTDTYSAWLEKKTSCISKDHSLSGHCFLSVHCEKIQDFFFKKKQTNRLTRSFSSWAVTAIIPDIQRLLQTEFSYVDVTCIILRIALNWLHELHFECFFIYIWFMNNVDVYSCHIGDVVLHCLLRGMTVIFVF